MGQPWLFVVFTVFVLGMLALDLGRLPSPGPRRLDSRRRPIWSVVWISLAMVFDAGVTAVMGPRGGAGVPHRLPDREVALGRQHLRLRADLLLLRRPRAVPAPRALLGHPRRAGDAGGDDPRPAPRCSSSSTGSSTSSAPSWCSPGVRMATQAEHEIDPEHNPLLRLVRRAHPDHRRATTGSASSSAGADAGGASAWWRRRCSWCWCWWRPPTWSSPSTRSRPSSPSRSDPFLVYTSNVFAILGLRSLYFLLAGVIDKFHYLKLGLSVVLVFVGAKMLLVDVYKVPIGLSLGVIAARARGLRRGVLALPQGGRSARPGGARSAAGAAGAAGRGGGAVDAGAGGAVDAGAGGAVDAEPVAGERDTLVR